MADSSRVWRYWLHLRADRANDDAIDRARAVARGWSEDGIAFPPALIVTTRLLSYTFLPSAGERTGEGMTSYTNLPAATVAGARHVLVSRTVLVECVSPRRDTLRDGADGTRLEGRGSAARLALVAEASPSKSRAWLYPQLSR